MNKTEWVPVTEALPKKNQGPRLRPGDNKNPKILVEVLRRGGVSICHYQGFYPTEDGGGFDDDWIKGEIGGLPKSYEVIAWRAIPEDQWESAMKEYKTASENYRNSFPAW